MNEIYKIIFEDMKKNGPELFFGKHDTNFLSTEFFKGIFLVMDYIAEKAGEGETYLDFFNDNFYNS